MEEMNQNVPWQAYPGNAAPPSAPVWTEQCAFPTGKSELVFSIFAVICGLMLCNFTLFGGFNLGFALAVIACIICAVVYLRFSGCRMGAYSTALLGLSVIIAAGFARTDDGFVKFVMVCFLLLAVSLALCLMAEQNRRDSGSIHSLLDAPRGFFVFGLGQLPQALRGLRDALRGSGTAGRKFLSVLAGLAVTVPVLAILIPLLIRADAAFDGLLALLPEFDFGQAVITVLFGAGAACFIYTQSTALRHKAKDAPATDAARRSVNHLTVNTVLTAVSVLYLVYLFSQLAYFAGGFSGILPAEFTMAEYARRGFFEMGWLCAIDLTVIVTAVALVEKKDGKAPLLTRLLCLFIGIATVFLVVTASAKMAMYIGSFGLTRLRLLTEIIMVFLGLTTAVVSLWLFVPKLPYMKVVLLLALVIGAATIWADVDTVVAAYNVSAYQSGRLDEIDISYLRSLGDGAIPQIAKLVDDPVAGLEAQSAVQDNGTMLWTDFRDWNFASWLAEEFAKGSK